MRLTHFGHSCVLVELNGTTVLFDPGTFSHGFEGITGLDAILVTHQHPDHVDLQRLPTLVEANPRAALHADPMTAGQLGGQWAAAPAGKAFAVGGITVTGVGGTHAVIHPELPEIDNTGYLLGTPENPGQLFHPGDSLFVPEQQVDVLALPAAAPWSKLSETVEFLRAVAPKMAFPIHQAVIADQATGAYYGRFKDMSDAEFRELPKESSVSI
ncbi:MBL fold metallo-hydrolase [Rhodococcus sp. 15-649-2-2]|uniref:MBL fold metallo-hydrolase n=1 Tax=Rhodococcus sp. 15-649-2-2 TaxID=2023140 RepID=UPI000B9C6139|nr:MBL fold metallo-hydrolase [Rhodococcus sp. 15-649-2-2]OZE86398.1 MBL fold metallo-hydrolase [Rhodococcus sp. 15-649-2-2]